MKKTKILFLLLSFMAVFAMVAGSFVPQAQAAEQKVYEIGTDETFAPFEFQNKKGELVGIDMDILKAIAKDQDFQYNVKPLGFNAAVQALTSNQVDGVIAGMSITDERKQKFDFSDPYFESGIVMAIKKGDDSIKSYEDLRGKKVAVKTGTEGYAFADANKEKYGYTLVPFDDSASMYADVRTGNSVACFDDYPVLAYGVKQGNGLDIVTEKEKGNSYGFAVNKGKNQELLEKFNVGLTNIKASGEYKEIIDRYIGSDVKPQSFWDLLIESAPALLLGLWYTIKLTLISLVFAAILGLVFGFLKVSRSKVLRGIATVYVDIFRGIPLIVLAFFIYFGIPEAMGFKMDATVAAVITLSLNAGAYITEIIRGGIQAVDKGQMEAGRSLGLPYGKTMIKIILPQAIRVMIPSFINQFVITLKDTSIMSVIGLVELTQSGKIIIARTFESSTIWLIVAIMYLIVITALTKLSNVMERRVNND
ncbi:glutamine ABC transporter permease [Listeria newyorkensis]|uniref:Glutamine ABC transporter permease n=2 Tax=Listeria newyorkensis TaxID=1497681 RepID=A0ABX4XQT0_9LIST|nr:MULTISPECIES: amino acid ABC transporter substrate-binding protein/permease [Listeria]KGL39626.1 glutamine ABC transporter permease [Listeriaceae bacterium FSL A5-0209]KGL44036.1 glutamine ABC transporter permease [Listeria newyorkensis]KMT61497.1 polar amino acid ABC transporter inner membrane subunit [Listeria newyorkensis]PNP94834.1 glutamine ABC transporter permease [Listeria newyorkensis]RQW67170.1 ABC transporter permease subunit [Listeria sp. SHR_NRA_18]